MIMDGNKRNKSKVFKFVVPLALIASLSISGMPVYASTVNVSSQADCTIFLVNSRRRTVLVTGHAVGN